MNNIIDKQYEVATVKLCFKKIIHIWRKLNDVIIMVISGLKYEVTSETLYIKIISAIAKIFGYDNHLV